MKNNRVTIAIDGMGGDRGHIIVIPACLSALKKYPELDIVLVGDEKILVPLVPKAFHDSARFRIHHASEVVGMDELPSQALRYKKDSSMRVAINLVKEGQADACVSAGNTGALMAIARFVLKMLPGIDRPAIISALPASGASGCVRILDLGANVDSGADQLVQFAVMGSVLTSAIEGIKAPKVALLNIGEEEIKGNDQVKLAARLLSDMKGINYIGYVEGDAIFKGVADVIVCDGFVGNVALKTIEGATKFIGGVMKKAFVRNLFTKLAGAAAVFVLRSLKKTLNPDLYNGATFVGLRSIVVKSHGGTSALGFEQAIKHALLEVEHNVPALIEDEVTKLLDQP